MHSIPSMTSSTAALLVTAGLLTIPASSAFAQTDTATTTLSPEVTEEVEDSTQSEDSTAPDKPDSTGVDDGSWTGTPTTTGGGYPQYVNCSANGSVGEGGEMPWPGGTFPGSTQGFPGFPGGVYFGSLSVQCWVEGHSGYNMYRCSCGDEDSKSGELPPSWFQERPEWSERLEGCQEILRSSCGNMRVGAQVDCNGDFGRCSLRTLRRDDELKRDVLAHGCECVDGDGWSSVERLRDVDVLSPSASQLEQRCADELSHCGGGSFGQAGAGLLVSAQKGRLETSCRSSYGSCSLSRNAQGLAAVRCGCVDGSSTNFSGDLGWQEADLSTLVQDCEQRVRACAPSQPSGTTTGGGFPGEGAGATGGAVAGDDQSGDSVIRVESGSGKSVSCSIGAPRSSAALTLFGVLGLLGWRRRR